MDFHNDKGKGEFHRFVGLSARNTKKVFDKLFKYNYGTEIIIR